ALEEGDVAHDDDLVGVGVNVHLGVVRDGVLDDLADVPGGGVTEEEDLLDDGAEVAAIENGLVRPDDGDVLAGDLADVAEDDQVARLDDADAGLLEGEEDQVQRLVAGDGPVVD